MGFDRSACIGLSINAIITETNNNTTIAINGSGVYAVGSYDNTLDTRCI